MPALRSSILHPPSHFCSGAFQTAVARSDKNTIYSILTFLLGKLPALKKRAYVARYLLPIDVPPEFLANESLAETLAQYRALQAEFKEGHKAYEKALQAMTAPNGQPKRPPAELRKEISQLEDERRQLVEKIAGLKKRNADAVSMAAELERALRTAPSRPSYLRGLFSFCFAAAWFRCASRGDFESAKGAGGGRQACRANA
jgi:hypothetical protein